MSFTQGSFNNQQSNVYVSHALEKLQNGILDVKRPDLLYPMTIPEGSWDMGVAPGYEYISKVAQDWSGAATLRAAGSNQVGTLSTNSVKITNQIYTGGLMNGMDLKTIRSSKILVEEGYSSDPETYALQIANQAIKNFYEKFLLFGCAIDDGSNFYHTGFLNNPLSSVGSVSGGTWDTKTADEIIFDLQSAIISLTTESNDTINTTDVYLPIFQYNLIAYTKAGSTANGETILSYVNKYGLAQQRNGAPGVTISPYRYLAGAGVGGTDRMIVCEKKPENYIVANPIDFEIVSQLQLGYQMNTWYGFEISTLMQPWPNAVAYFDGI